MVLHQKLIQAIQNVEQKQFYEQIVGLGDLTILLSADEKFHSAI